MEAESHGKNVHLIKGSDQDAGGQRGSVCLSGYIIKWAAAGNGGNTVLLRLNVVKPFRVGQRLLDGLPLSATLEPTLWNRGYIFAVRCTASADKSELKYTIPLPEGCHGEQCKAPSASRQSPFAFQHLRCLYDYAKATAGPHWASLRQTRRSRRDKRQKMSTGHVSSGVGERRACRQGGAAGPSGFQKDVSRLNKTTKP